MHEEKRNAYRVLVGKLQGRRPLGRIILRWILKKWDGVRLNGLIWLRIGTSGGLGLHNGGKFMST
jgi:hypothetical protein